MSSHPPLLRSILMTTLYPSPKWAITRFFFIDVFTDALPSCSRKKGWSKWKRIEYTFHEFLFIILWIYNTKTHFECDVKFAVGCRFQTWSKFWRASCDGGNLNFSHCVTHRYSLLELPQFLSDHLVVCWIISTSATESQAQVCHHRSVTILS
jgi:hypothetical protein